MSEFQTSDLFLAAYLKGVNFEVIDIKKEGIKTIFCFKDKEERKQLVLDFYNNKGSIEPLTFVRNWKDLKSLTFNI